MEAQSGIWINAVPKSARADEVIQKMVVGDGNALYDAMTDNDDERWRHGRRFCFARCHR